ncbi:MAG: pseudouridine synthase [Oscillospiraceae bacterium]|nr:pseudouridine synthase [Oscillospiraceae bacterium]
MPAVERLQKILSSAGVCSRRAAEALLSAGRITVNGRTAGVGDKADPLCDTILVDGAPLVEHSEKTYLMLNKPRGYVTTLSDEKGRKTVAGLVASCGVRVWPVGRLDMDSQGLLLLTNDGEWTNRLIHPRHEVEKEYLVGVAGDVRTAIPVLSKPMTIDGILLRPAAVRQIGQNLISVTIHEGKNRQVRRMCAAAGLQVSQLTRIRIGQLLLGDLPPGQWRKLSEQELLLLTR